MVAGAAEKDHLDEIKAIWGEIEGKDDEQLTTYLRESDRFLRHENVDEFRAYFFFRRKSLGIIPRLFVIRDLLAPGKVTYGEFEKHYKSRSRNVVGIPASDALKKALQFGKSPIIAVERLHTIPLSEFFAEWLCESLRLPDRIKALAEGLFTIAFDGPRAVDEYADWIRTGFSIRSATSFLPPGQRFLDSPERDAAIMRVSEWLFARRAPMVLNAYRHDMPNGLTALAGRLVTIAGGQIDNRRILYLPLRGVGGFNAPGYSQLLARLHAFFTGSDVEDAPDIEEHRLEEVIQEIRHQMMVSPAIVMLDGYTNTTSRLAELDRIIRDDQVLSLVEKLRDPPLTAMYRPESLSLFLRNRILLLSDEEIELNDCIQEEIPAPKAEDMRQVLENQDLDEVVAIRNLLEIVPELRSARSEAVLRILDSLIRIERKIAQLADLPWDADACAEHLRECIGRGLRSADSVDRKIVELVGNLLLDRISETFPDYHAVLTLIALTPDGIRRDTLSRVAVLAARCRLSNDEFHSPLPSPSACMEAFDSLLTLCRAILTAERSDKIAGLDDYSHPWEFSVSEISTSQSHANEPVATEFRIPAFRDMLCRRIREQAFRPEVQPLHRLLAEEALRQATIAFRHDDDLKSGRSLRRLLSTLYHGFQSIPIDGTGTIVMADYRNAEFAIPESSSDAWEWLYLFAYRRMIEQPPTWNLSRQFGLDRVKQDILDLADRPWDSWPAHLHRPDIRHGDGIVFHRARDPRTRKIAADFYLSQSQNAYALGNSALAVSALEKSMLMEEDGPRKRPSKQEKAQTWLRNPRVAKKMLDVALLDGRFDDIEIVEKALRDEASEKLTGINEYLDQTTSKLVDLVSAHNFQPVVHDLPVAHTVTDLVIKAHQSGNRENVSQLCGILFRIGEFYALKGDIENAAARARELQNQKTAEPRYHRTRYENVILMLCRSMAYFRLAEALRLRVFQEDPTGSHFFASGHSARQMIRVGLKLEQFARREIANPAIPHGFFARRSRHMANVITRHLFRYPRERASMLIIEASISRLLSFDTNKVAGLESARDFLDHAEPVVLALGTSPRVRRRFRLERLKIHRRLALARKDDPLAAGMYFDLAEQDLVHLKEHSSDQLWHQLVQIQEQSIDRTRHLLGDDAT